MHRTLLTLSLLAGLSMTGSATAQVAQWNPATGDILVDQHIGQQNLVDRERFLDRLVNEFGGDRSDYVNLLNNRQITQAELYYACSLGAISEVSCTTVVDQRMDTRSRGQGWGALAQRYGIKPGSAQFHALKNRIGQAHEHEGHAMMGSEGARRGQAERMERMDRDDHNHEEMRDDAREKKAKKAVKEKKGKQDKKRGV